MASDISDIIDGISEHKLSLKELAASLDEARQQVIQSADKSRNELTHHFTKLRTAITLALDSRLSILLSCIDAIEESALTPLGECDDIIQAGISTAATIIDEGKLLLKPDSNQNEVLLLDYKDKVNGRSLNSLPEVPGLSDVPCISVDLTSSPLTQVLELIGCEGRVIEKPPVQITQFTEMPGSLVISWDEVDEDSSLDISEFCLEYCYGRVTSHTDTNITYHQGYVGPERSCTVKQLRVDTPYTFRVSCRGEGDTDWNPWSIPRVAMTTIPHYQWCSKLDSYSTSNERRTATRVSDDENLYSVLYSNDRTYKSGQTITFRVLDSNEVGVEDGIGLAMNSYSRHSLRSPGVIFVSAKGLVYIDGKVMKNKLPPLHKGSSLTLQTKLLTNHKVRVSAQVDDKDITFDWQPEKNENINNSGDNLDENVADLGLMLVSRSLYFAMCFGREDWKVSVE